MLKQGEYALFEHSPRKPLFATRVSKDLGSLIKLARLRFGANGWAIKRYDGVIIVQTKGWLDSLISAR